jgi:hypothetical protein
MLGLSGLRLYVALGAILAIVAFGAATAVLKSRLDAKEAAISSLSQQLAMAAGDAARWRLAAEQRQGVIDRQAATLRRLESDAAAARAIAEANETRAGQRIAALEARLSELKEAAHARPEDVRPLGPIVLGALPSLRH